MTQVTFQEEDINPIKIWTNDVNVMALYVLRNKETGLFFRAPKANLALQEGWSPTFAHTTGTRITAQGVSFVLGKVGDLEEIEVIRVETVINQVELIAANDWVSAICGISESAP